MLIPCSHGAHLSIPVTTTSQAREALDMLRRDKDSFDLVISDVHMPDMDGFRLLELVGLEMDLPVISRFTFLIPFLLFRLHEYGAPRPTNLRTKYL